MIMVFFSLVHDTAPPFLIRGSTTPYSILAIKLPENTIAAVTRVIPIKSGTSLPVPAATAACPETRVRKYLFNQYRTADNLADRSKLKGECRKNNIAQAMPAYHTLSALSPCLCEQHIIAFHHIDHLLPGMERDIGNTRDGKGECRKYRMLDTVEKRYACSLHSDRHA